MTIGLARENKIAGAVDCGIISTFCFCFLIFFIVPVVIGHGKVPNIVESFDTRLSREEAYQLVASSKSGENNYVLLVKKYGTERFFAIRAEKLPPEVFTLVDGNPVAIIPLK